MHFLVPGGGLSTDGERWLRARNHFFVHVKPLARLFRGKMRDGLRKAGLLSQVCAESWHQDWVVDCRPIGKGETALKYLAPYVFRVALSNRRILKTEKGQVTFRYRDGETKRQRRCMLAAEAFIHRFLQHVLPKGFVKVRYYGLLVPRYRKRLTQANPLYASRLSGYFLSVTGGNCMGLHLTSLLSRPTLNTMRVLGWLSRAARNHGNKTEIP